MVQLRPKGDYEKYLKLLVSLMILSQITFALTGLWKGGGEQEKQLEALEQQIADCQAQQAACGSDYVQLQQLQEQQSALEAALEEKTERWVYLNELKEKIDAQETQ